MKSDKKIMIAFLLNSVFSVCELAGGIFTGSVAILSDAVHDMGDALSIGLSFILERKSKGKPDARYTCGYRRYSVLGAAVTDVILMVGSVIVIFKGIDRIINPEEINSSGMIVFAIFGFVTNSLAAFMTCGGESMNLRAVNLHMLEDVLGWAVVLIGSIIIQLTSFYVIDPIMSVVVAAFVLFHAVKGFKKVVDLFLEKTPKKIDVEKIKKHLLEIEGVTDIHHIHIRSADGVSCSITLHAVIDGENIRDRKLEIKKELKGMGFMCSTVETEFINEDCRECECIFEHSGCSHHGHCH